MKTDCRFVRSHEGGCWACWCRQEFLIHSWRWFRAKLVWLSFANWPVSSERLTGAICLEYFSHESHFTSHFQRSLWLVCFAYGRPLCSCVVAHPRTWLFVSSSNYFWLLRRCPSVWWLQRVVDGWIEDEREDVDEFGILLGDGIGRAMRISITQGIERQRNGPILYNHESTSSKRHHL